MNGTALIRFVFCASTAIGLCLFPASPARAGEAWDAAAMDWPHWRGPEMNGISRETNLVDGWSPRGENLLWKKEELATRSTPIVMNGKIYLLARDRVGTPQEGEKVVCADAETGEILWQNRFNVFLSDVPDTRVAWSSVAGDPETGNVFALGVCDYFQCIDGETGETLWEHSLSEEYGMLNTYGGRTNFPIVFEDLVIISGIVIGWGDKAKPAHRFIAFDQRNGQPVWYTETRLLPYDTTYSSPVLGVVDGQAMMVFGSGDGGVHAFQPRTGKSIWSYHVSSRGINTTPVIAGDTVVCGMDQENLDSSDMGALFALDATKTGELSEENGGVKWRVTERYAGKGQPLVIDGRIYYCDDPGTTGTLRVVDLETGEEIASQRLRGPTFGSPLYADGKIYVCTENGVWWTFQPTEDGLETVSRDRMRIGSVTASPIVSHGRIYLATSEALYCIGSEDQEPAVDSRPEPPEETPVSEDRQAAQAQVVPAESLLWPGQKQQYDVRLYNANGQYVRTATSEAEFSIDGPGEIDGEGLYATPNREGTPAAVLVNAEAEGVTGTARGRVVPDFPWNVDFSDGEVPVTWVGARYRHIALDFDLLQELKGQDPRAAGLYIYLMTEFINSGRDSQTFDDTTPRQRWTDLLRYFELEDTVTNVEEARQELGPGLKLLQEKNVLADVQWTALEGEETQLSVTRGPRNVEGNGVMVKVTTIPKGVRSQGWMGHPGFHDYTIQADVRAAEEGDEMPDIGLIAQRYTLDLRGSYQQLEIRSWPTVRRMAKSVPFEWKPNVWYTMKLQASLKDGEAVLRGKVWPRDEQEPEEWALEAVDPQPNVQGSPGLYGDATNAEIFYDNIEVKSNDAAGVQAAEAGS